jgi:hypothetical protein
VCSFLEAFGFVHPPTSPELLSGDIGPCVSTSDSQIKFRALRLRKAIRAALSDCDERPAGGPTDHLDPPTVCVAEQTERQPLLLYQYTAPFRFVGDNISN